MCGSDWVIRGRVVNKFPIKYFTSKSSRSEGKLFSIDIIDSNGGEIQCTFFGEACDSFFNMIEKDKVYELSRG
jgi:hypothetical protein